MRSARATRLLVLLAILASAAPASAAGPVVGVSWSNFQEERWKIDQAALVNGLEERGARVLSADAQSSTEKQLADIESLITRGAEVLVIVAHDARAVQPAVAVADAEGIPVIAYDRLIEAPGVLYLSFDNREVGRIQAREIQRAVPRGRYVFIKGAPTDPNTDFVHAGQLDVLSEAIAAGDVQVVGDQYVEGWLPEVAQRTMEQILTATDNRIDAVVCSNDGMASGVVAALAAQGLEGVPVSGQDGDRAALNRVARGVQTVSVWKDARKLGAAAARAAVALAGGATPAEIEGATIFDGGPQGRRIDAVLLEPVPITRERLGLVIEAGWIGRDALCRGATEPLPAACR